MGEKKFKKREDLIELYQENEIRLLKKEIEELKEKIKFLEYVIKR